MRKFYTATVALCVAAASVAGPQQMDAPMRQRVANVKSEMKAAMGRLKKSSRPRHAEAEPVYRPVVQKLYAPVGDGAWELDATYRSEWNAQGRPVRDVITSEAEGSVQVITYAYDAHGNVVEKIVKEGDSEQTAAEMSKTVSAYDEKMPWVETLHEVYIFNDKGQWELDPTQNIYKREVTRNADGNVLTVVRSTLYGAEWSPNTKFEAEYGADGKPVRLSEASYDDTLQDWSLTDLYTDCQWDACTAQFASMDNCLEHGNQLVAFTAPDEDDEPLQVQVLYLEDGSYVSYADIAGLPMYMLTRLLPNNSYRSTGVGELEIMPGMSLFIGYAMAEIYDELDNVLLVAEYDFDKEEGITDVYTWMQGDNTPDPVFGNMPSSYRLSDFYADEPDDEEEEYYAAAASVPALRSVVGKISAADLPDFSKYEYTELPADIAGEWEEFVKIEFSQYQNFAGINSIAADNAAISAPEYYTVDGRHVDTPAPGLYIVRQGSRVSKAVVR